MKYFSREERSVERMEGDEVFCGIGDMMGGLSEMFKSRVKTA